MGHLSMALVVEEVQQQPAQLDQVQWPAEQEQQLKSMRPQQQEVVEVVEQMKLPEVQEALVEAELGL